MRRTPPNRWVLGEVDATQTMFYPSWIQLLLHHCPSAGPDPNPAHPGPAARAESWVGAAFRTIEEQLLGEACEYARTRTRAH